MAGGCYNALNPKHPFTCAIPLVAKKSHEQRLMGQVTWKGLTQEGFCMA